MQYRIDLSTFGSFGCVLFYYLDILCGGFYVKYFLY